FAALPAGWVNMMLGQGVLVVGRNLRRTVRTPEIVASALLIPLLLYLVFLAAFAKTVLPGEGYSAYAAFALPGVIAFALGFAVPHAAVAIQRDLHDGYLDRLRSMPISRSAALAGRVGADALTTGGQVLLLTAVGFAFGAGFHGGVLEAIAYLLVPMGIATMFCWLMIPLALRAKSPEGVAGVLNLVIIPLGYISGGMVPVTALPSWIQPIAWVNPLTSMVDVMRSSFTGTLDLATLWPGLAWIVGGTAVAVPLAVRAYRRLGG
ncbi:MAG: ABC transporter permease, partial [Pseudonocardiaceae bacterium]